MPEAVIVATARSPIGRAIKGSLATMRPDDLAAQMVRAALDKVPALDPRDIDDLMMGCGQPAGEAGFNIARAVAVELGYDFLPGTTVNRYCSSSLQTTRMAFHAIKAGEGDVFISAGVETVSRFGNGAADGRPNSKNPLFAEAQERTVAQSAGADEWHDPRDDGNIPDVYIAMGQTAENVALFTGISREDQDHWGVRIAEPRRGGHQQRLLRARDRPRHAARRHRRLDRRRPARRHHLREDQPAQAGVPAQRHDHRRQRLPAERRRRGRRHHERHQGQGTGPDPAGAHRVDGRVSGLSPEIMGLGPDRGDQEGARRRPASDLRHRPGRDQRGVRRAGARLGPRAGHRRGQAQRLRRRDRAGPPVRHDRRPHHRHAAQQPATHDKTFGVETMCVGGGQGMAMVVERLS